MESWHPHRPVRTNFTLTLESWSLLPVRTNFTLTLNYPTLRGDQYSFIILTMVSMNCFFLIMDFFFKSVYTDQEIVNRFCILSIICFIYIDSYSIKFNVKIEEIHWDHVQRLLFFTAKMPNVSVKAGKNLLNKIFIVFNNNIVNSYLFLRRILCKMIYLKNQSGECCGKLF